MSELEIRNKIRSMKRGDLMLFLASLLLLERGQQDPEEKQLREVMEQNFMGSVAMEDLRLEIINSMIRLKLTN